MLMPPRDGQQLDPHLIEKALLHIHQRNPIHTVVMDTSFGAGVMAIWITENLGSDIIGRGQTLPQQVEEYERFMEGLRSGWLHHSGDAGLTSHAMNAIARMNRLGATVFDRPNPQRTGGATQDLRVIDALDAAAMVHAQAMVASAQPQSVGSAMRMSLTERDQGCASACNAQSCDLPNWLAELVTARATTRRPRWQQHSEEHRHRLRRPGDGCLRRQPDGLRLHQRPRAAVQRGALQVPAHEQRQAGRAVRHARDLLRLLEQPWPGGTTGELLKDALIDADLAGNAFIYRAAPACSRLRPDWVTIIAGNPRQRRHDVGSRRGGPRLRLPARRPGQRPGAGHPARAAGRALQEHPRPAAPLLGHVAGWCPSCARSASDQAATSHKLKYFENAATPNMVVKFDPRP